MSELQEQLNKLEKSVQETSKNIEDKLNTLQEKAEKEDVQRLEESIKTDQEERKKLQEEIDQLKSDINNPSGGASKGHKLKDFEGYNNAVEAYKNGKIVSGSVELPESFMKSEMTVSGNFDDRVVRPDREPGAFVAPQRPRHLREIMNVGATSSDKVEFIREDAAQRSMDVTSRQEFDSANQKGESSTHFNLVKFDVINLAHTFRVTTNMIQDAEFIEDYIRTEGRQALMDEEDRQILSGSGGQELEGLFPNASDFDETNFTNNVSNIQHEEVERLVWAIKQAFVDHYRPDWILLHPQDAFKIRLLKDANNNFLFPINNMNQLMFAGVPVLEHTEVNTGEFLLGDFQRGNTLKDRMGISVRFAEEDRDNIPANLVTVKIEKRLTHVIYFDEAFVQGNLESTA